MTDPQTPDVPAPHDYNQPPAPPAYNTTPPANQPAYGQQAYSAAPPAPYGAPGNPTIPGKTMGIVAFILSFFVQLVALILGIVALVQSRKAGYPNGWALAAIIISSVLLVIGIIVGIFLFIAFGAAAAEYARLCAEFGSGVHEIGGVTVTLTCPSS
ncbi:DUF4190 domain-containing protein [Microbacterium terregens]|uniref:DUF4190 domain-containing protein n=1 Tax=Microbacterium terregens TaxID=69363 RepID=A0ABV5T058_9MICO